MTWVLWLNTLAETAIAIGMFTMPASFFPGAEGLALKIAKIFAFAILAVAYISFSLQRRETSPETRRNGVWILFVYHSLQLAAQFVVGATAPPILIPPVVIHTVFVSLFGAYLVRLTRTREASPAAPPAAH